jgi:SSS family solute:Na+ symporter
VNALDWTIIGLYLAAMIGLAVYLGRGQTNEQDYFVGGRNLPWWSVGVSTMATQSGVISFVSIPAFVALQDGGGFTWLQYELALPLAMIAVMVLLIPFFRKLELVSVYEYLEGRYGTPVRLTVSGMFLLSRGGATGVTVFTAAIVLQECVDLDPVLVAWLGEGARDWSLGVFGFGLEMLAIILLVGIVTIVYDTIGGMAGVVYSDVIQMVVLVAGVLLCIFYATDAAGGASAVLDSFPEARWNALDMTHGLGDAVDADGNARGLPFWAMLVGGFFLYASYYGVDQSQTQRELSAPTLRDTKRSLVFNALGRFPLTLLYMIMGVAVGAAFLELPELQEAVRARWAETGKPDSLLPLFIVQQLPEGVRAVIIAACLAAAMSSLDSALNSLSAATVRDFIARGRTLEPSRLLRLSKVTTVVWGVAIVGFGLFVGRIGGTVIEVINKLGSLFYGPILAAFVLGVLTRWATGRGVIAGVVAGIAVNAAMWLGAPSIHWMWWNLVGFVVTVATTFAASRLEAPPTDEQLGHYTLSGTGMLAAESKWLKTYGILVGYFALMIGAGIVLFGVR